MADLRGAFLGVGKLYLEDLDDTQGLIFVGNCNSLSYEATPQEIEEQDYTTPGGGLDASVQRISALNVYTLSLHDALPISLQNGQHGARPLRQFH